MNDQYRITPASAAHTPADHTPAVRSPRGLLRPALWLTLFVTAAANMVFSTLVGNAVVGSAFGLAALISAGTLIAHHYRTRATDAA
jgi:hypothetical protein